MSDLTAADFRKKTKPELEEILKDLDKQKFNMTAQSGKKNPQLFRQLKKSRARVLTVMNEMTRKALKEFYKGKKHIPYDLRPKTSRAERRRLTPAQKNKLTARQKRLRRAYPKRVYALKSVA